jgi:hypothetical protein
MKDWVDGHVRAGIKALATGIIVGGLAVAGVSYGASGDGRTHRAAPPGPPAAVLSGHVNAPVNAPPSNHYFGSASGLSTGSSDRTTVETLSPASSTGVAQNLAVRLAQPAGGSLPTVVEISVIAPDGSSNALSCQVPAGQAACSNTTDNVTVQPGSRLAFFTEQDNDFTPTSVAFGFELR